VNAMTGAVAGKVANRHRRRGAASAAASRCCWARGGLARVVRVRHRREPRRRPAPMPAPAPRRGRRDQDGRRRGNCLHALDRRAEKNADEDRQRPRSTAFPGRVDILVKQTPGILRDRILPPHELVRLVGRALRVHLNRLLQHEPWLAPCTFASRIPAAFVHMNLDLGAGRQLRPGQLHGGEVRHRGLCRAASHSTCSASKVALELHPRRFAWTRMIDSIPAETPGEKARGRADAADDAGRRSPPLTVYLGSDAADGITGQIFGGSQQRDFPVQSAAPRCAPSIAPTAGRRRRSSSSSRGAFGSSVHAASSARPMCSPGTRCKQN